MIVFLAAASIFTAASVDGLRGQTCVKLTCKANEECFYFSYSKTDIIYKFKKVSIDESSGFSIINIDNNFCLHVSLDPKVVNLNLNLKSLQFTSVNRRFLKMKFYRYCCNKRLTRTSKL